MNETDFQSLYEDLRPGASNTHGRGLAVFMRSGLAAWMTLLSTGDGNATRVDSPGPTRAQAPAARHEVVQVLAAMVTGHLQGAYS